MLNRIDILAPCKINLHLRVLDKRADGFHDIESVFQLVSFSDELSISISGEKGSLEILSPNLQLPSVNTVSQAVELFRDLTDIKDGLRVNLIKHVPCGAGLGGGSSDAAATLKALNSLFSADVEKKSLFDMAAKIGSDVPFFLTGGAALVSGRGEKISSIPCRPDLFGVLVNPGVHVSTPEAYGLVDRWQEKKKRTTESWLSFESLGDHYKKPPKEWEFENSFTEPVSELYPVVLELREKLRDYGANFTDMSGSGSSVYGIFENERDADLAKIMLCAHYPMCVKFLLLAS